ncbi:MAG: TetR/AcrR family transcriptional regulator [Polyangiales bacterium]
MSRPPGSRNADFDQTRADLLDRVVHAVARHPERSSFAELAEASGVSRTTLRHYFTSRDELLHAMLAHMRTLSDRAGAAHPVSAALPLEEALRLALHQLVFAWRVGVGSLFAAGLLWGLGDEALGPAYVTHLLEPMLASFEGHIAARLDADGGPRPDARHASLALVSPVVLALLHQESLHGVKCRPLDLDVFVEEHLQRFLAGWCRDRSG